MPVGMMRGNREKHDERVVRTSKRLDAAFVELLRRRAYGNLRVSDIAKKAGVGRATFYAHYASKDDLLRSQFRRKVAPMLATGGNDACLVDASLLLAHVRSDPRFFIALVRGPDAGGGPRIIRECFEERVRGALELRSPVREPSDSGVKLQRAILVRTVASTLLGVVECWVENGMSGTPQQMQAIFSQLVGRGVEAMGAAPLL